MKRINLKDYDLQNDILVYAKPEISWQEMENIRLQLLRESRLK